LISLRKETEMPIPKVGARAPGLELPSDSGEIVRLSEHLGRTVVLYFYPKDDTPG
jgi:peroxiredoxin Q/BCP